MKEQTPEKESKQETKTEVKTESKSTPKPEVKAETPTPSQQPVQKKTKYKLALIHVFSSKNDTIITATDQSGAETLAWASGGMIVKADREEGRPYAAMQAALKVVNTLKEKGVGIVHLRIRAPGGSGPKTPGSGAQAVVRTIARTGIRITRIDDVTPLPTDSMKRKGGRRGRRV
ncbi:30S ribosomal protein S11 [Candidatus Micrarchaeota archaeon]|nr:30S ribosomal protein S11 [Candidatus Micrarchaeota archaeon]